MGDQVIDGDGFVDERYVVPNAPACELGDHVPRCCTPTTPEESCEREGCVQRAFRVAGPR
jgi:hypothetical protein